MKYKIKIKYQTGDSFNTYEEEDILDLEFSNLEILEENINRIIEQNKYYRDNFEYGDISVEEAIEKYGKERWFPKKNVGWDSAQNSVVLLDDSGNSFQYSTSQWNGYFETLLSIEAVVDLPKYEIELY